MSNYLTEILNRIDPKEIKNRPLPDLNAS